MAIDLIKIPKIKIIKIMKVYWMFNLSCYFKKYKREYSSESKMVTNRTAFLNVAN